MSSAQTVIDPSHELKAAPEFPELEAHYEYPELSAYEGYLAELETMLKKHGKTED